MYIVLPISPTTTGLTINKLQAQVNAVVATIARAIRVHDEHDDRTKYGVDVLLNLGCERVDLVESLLYVLSLRFKVRYRVDYVLND